MLRSASSRPASPLFRVGRSNTGLGLFAVSAIAKGTRIVEYTGPRLPTAEAKARERQRGSRYMFEVNSRWTIDGSVRSNRARYANHACKPNAEAVLANARVFLYARKTIKPGEEITYDYGREYVALFFKRHGCRCATCRAKRAKTGASAGAGSPTNYPP